MNLTSLSNFELTRNVESLCSGERKTTLEVLYYLIEIDNRRLYADLGFTSLFDFCVRKLKYSDGGAARRVAAARCLRERSQPVSSAANLWSRAHGALRSTLSVPVGTGLRPVRHESARYATDAPEARPYREI